jgi:hypothetical protein
MIDADRDDLQDDAEIESALAQLEAGRVLIERPPDPRLAAEGWERRFTTFVARVPEFAEMYGSMGFEVRAEPIGPDEVDPDCGDCGLVLHRLIVTIYTRRR